MHSELDHLVWAVPDLDEGIKSLAQRTGVTSAVGGRHPGVGTHNALKDLGGRRYFEILAPDPAQDRFSSFGRLIQGIERPKLLTWAARTDDIRAVSEAAKDAGCAPGVVLSLSRRRPDGQSLSWKLMQISGHGFGPLLPFFVEWRADEHPSDVAPRGCRLSGFELRTPEPKPLRALLSSLGLDPSTVAEGVEPEIRAVLETPKGRVELV
ncbi:MAG: VOC family protein [Acidobacteriota bacterium]